MKITDYHAKYYAHELTKRCSSDSLDMVKNQRYGKIVRLWGVDYEHDQTV